MSKNRKPKRLPAIVPRFLKSAVTVGAIPALWGCGNNHPRMQPVVAQMVNEPQPVVAAYQPDRPIDASVDAAPPPIQAPVVAAVVPHGPPPVVAAMVPHPLAPPAKNPPNKKPKAAKQPPPPPPPVVAMMVAPHDRDPLGPVPKKSTKP